MSLFKLLYENILLASHEFVDLRETSCDIYPDISQKAIDSLFCIHNYAVVHTRYPYNLTIKQLNYFLILYTTAGYGVLQYNEQDYILSPGSIAFIDCSAGFHLQLHNCSTWTYQRIYLNSSNLDYYFSLFYSDKTPVIFLNKNSNVRTAIEKLTDYTIHNNSNELVYSMLIDSLLTNLVVEKHSTNDCEQPPAYIQLILDQFDSQYDKNYSLDQLAKQYKVSKYTLSRNFTHFIGVSPIEYLISKRITVAKQLLIETELTISEVSNKVGISNQTHFINLFRKRVGVTPLQYRKQTTPELLTCTTISDLL